MHSRFAVVAVAVVVFGSGGLFAQRCPAQDEPPRILRNIEAAVGVIPKVFGAPQADPPVANLAEKPAWSIAPARTRALSIVRDMQGFSEKLDHVARICGRQPPHVLERSLSQSRINAGLDRHGSLIWLFGKPERRSTVVPIVYALPSTDHDRLVAPFRPHYRSRGQLASFSINGNILYARRNQGHSLFAQPYALRWLSVCASSTGGFDRQLGPLNKFLSQQDIGFALSRQGLMDQTEVPLPFSEGIYVVPPVLRRIATESFEMSGFSTIAGGIEIKPGSSLSVSLAATIEPESEVSLWPKTMKLRPKTVLAQLPNCQPALIASFATCEQWNDWIERLLEQQLAVAADAEPDDFAGYVELGQVRGGTVLVANEWNASDEHVDQLYHVQLHVEDADRAFAGLRDCAQHLLTFYEEPAPFQIVHDERDSHQFLQLTVQGAEMLWWQKRVQPLTISAATLNPTTLAIQLGDATQLQAALTKIQAGDGIDGKVGIAKSLDLVTDTAQGLILLDPYSAALLLPRMGFGGDLALTFATRFGSLDALSSIAPLIALTKDSPPLVVAAEFEPTHLVLNVAGTEELVSKLGQPVEGLVPKLQPPLAGQLKLNREMGAQLLQVLRIFF